MNYVKKGAHIDASGDYRYKLWRYWADLNKEEHPLIFILLNPSTADVNIDDATVRKCVGFAKWNGFNGIVIYNIYAFRATNPDTLRVTNYPEGGRNDLTLAEISPDSTVIAGWGSHPQARERAAEVMQMHTQINFSCLGINKDGSPKHPLYLPYDSKIVDYKVP